MNFSQVDSKRVNSQRLKIILFGTGLYAETLRYYIRSITNWDIVAYTADSQYIETKENNGLPLIPFETIHETMPPDSYQMVMAVGYRRMNDIRAVKFLTSRQKGYHLPNLIHPTAILNNAIFGEGNIFLENVVIEPNAELGSNIIIWSSALIGHNTHVGNHNHFAAVSMIAGNVTIGESCFLGNHSTVKDGVTVAHHTLIGAGAYVSKNTQAYDVVVPARSLILDNRKSTDFI